MTSDSSVHAVLDAYPRIYFACHRRHVHDPAGGLLSTRQASILDHLDAVDPTSLNELAAHMGVTASTMSIAIDRLEQGGYVVREREASDRRRLGLRLTAAGERVREANSVLDPELVSSMLEELSPSDRDDALRGLALLARAADASMRKRSPALLRPGIAGTGL
jgi:MarR family transcriptional regulator, organic hydroperoxide resistance regulator